MQTISTKALELVYRLRDAARRNDEGQTTTEYVAITAVGVVLAVGLVWTALEGSLTTAITSIAGEISGIFAE